MNIWIFCQYASVPSIGQYTGHYDLARGLVTKGHDVTIFASSFSHYRFCETILEPGERRREIAYDGVRFVWLRTPPYSANDGRRIFGMGIYALRAAWTALRRRPAPDVCIGVCVHPLAGATAWLVAALRRARFVYEIRDLWPKVLIETGLLRERSIVAAALYRLERFLVSRADRIIGTWRHFDRYVAEIGGDPAKVVWIPQIADLDRRPARIPDPPETGPFTVMYTGGHVHQNALDVMLRAARLVRNSDGREVRFVLIGGGQEKANLVRLAADLHLDNVTFLDPLPKDRLYEEMARAHVFVVSLRANALHRYGISLNKLCDYLAMERPIVYASISTYNPVLEARAGIAIAPESPEQMADAILRLRDTPAAERRAMGQRAFRHLTEFHERTRMTARLEETLDLTCAASQES